MQDRLPTTFVTALSPICSLLFSVISRSHSLKAMQLMGFKTCLSVYSRIALATTKQDTSFQKNIQEAGCCDCFFSERFFLSLISFQKLSWYQMRKVQVHLWFYSVTVFWALVFLCHSLEMTKRPFFMSPSPCAIWRNAWKQLKNFTCSLEPKWGCQWEHRSSE